MSFTGLVRGSEAFKEKQELKLVVFWDEKECSLCRISQISAYDDYLSKEISTDGRFRFVVVVTPKAIESSAIKQAVLMSGMESVVWYDIDRVFYQNNSFLPETPFYHYFLLDENDRIILCGDPLSNITMKERYDFEIKSRLEE